jgi:hypothetical protein
MTYASTSASFSGRTDAAAVDKHRPVFRGRKGNARFSACNSASSELRSSVDTRSETQGMEAFEEMVVASRSKFVALAQAILRNREDAEDAVQNAGAGALVFDPTGNGRQAVLGAQSQGKAAFVYGGGVDFAVAKHVALRAEYRGFVYDRPDFGLARFELECHHPYGTTVRNSGLPVLTRLVVDMENQGAISTSWGTKPRDQNIDTGNE